MPNPIYRNTYAKINLKAIRHNIEAIQMNLGKQNKVIPVLKANAYGHGSIEVAKFLEKQNCDFFAVALLEEALELREAGIKTKILILGWVHPDYAYLAIQHNFILTVFQKEWLERAQTLSLSKTVKVNVKVDTRMGGNGIKREFEREELSSILKKITFIDVTGNYI